MAPSERSPLLSPHENEDAQISESSPLLSDQSDSRGDGRNNDNTDKSSAGTTRRIRWPSIIAMVALAGLVIAVIFLGFLVPPAIKTYAEHAAVLEPTGLSLESITPDGVRARIQARFRLDGSRVADSSARRIGRFATSLVRKLDTDETKVQVHLPHYENTLLGTAVVPPLTVNLVDGHSTELDFVADLSAGDADSVRRIANDWLEGRLHQLKVTGAAAIKIKTGFLPLGTHDVVESLVFEAKEIPSIPDYQIQRLNFHDTPAGDKGRMSIAADVSLTAYNEYPLSLTLPSLGFDILMSDCDPSEPYLKVATAVTKPITVHPEANVTVDATGIISEISDSLTRTCPQSKLSPLDSFIKQYLRGEKAKVFIRGQESGNSDLPDWLGSILKNVTVPIDFPGGSYNDLIKNISVTDVDFKLPSPFADPSDPNGKPRVSGTIEVLAALPPELGIDVGITNLRANSDVLYKGRKFGELNLREWQKAKSAKVIGNGSDEELLRITSKIVDCPLDVTDGDIFGDVMQKLLFGNKDILLDVNSAVDAKVSTVLGDLVLKEVPAKGQIPVKQLPGNAFGDLNTHVEDLVVLNTSTTGIFMRASVNLTNPTPYTASIPYVTVHVIKDGHIIGEVSAKDAHFQLGNNTNMVVYAAWDPVLFGGEASHEISRRLLSEYLSGKNTTITLKAHRDSIPAMPVVSEALSKITITLDTPRMKLPEEDEDKEQGHSYIRDATFHLLSSTASFSLASPLRHNTIHIERINATAFYNHTEPVGRIFFDESFAAPPGITETPRLPVTWSLSSVGFDRVREALGGSLKLDARANATIRIGNWVETVQYEGRGIGAKVRL